MSSALAIDGNSAITAAMQGLRNSSQVMSSAAKEVLKDTIRLSGPIQATGSSEYGQGQSRSDYISSLKDTISLSEFDRPLGMENALFLTAEASVSYTSNAKVVDIVKDNVGTILNTYA